MAGLQDTSSSKARKVCLIVPGKSSEGHDETNIFAVDPNIPPVNNIGEALAPTIRLYHGCSNDDQVFCVLGSTLYMIEASVTPGNTGRTAVCSFDLGDIDSVVETINLEKPQLTPLPPMNAPKFCPIALPTPDAKYILVFCSILFHGADEGCDFELFDPAQVKWHKLPGLLSMMACPRDLTIQMCTLTDQNVLLLHTDAGPFQFDLQSSISKGEGGWKPASTLPHDPLNAFYLPAANPYLLLDARFALSPFGCYDHVGRSAFHLRPPPKSYHPLSYYLHTTRAIAPLSTSSLSLHSGCRFCVLQIEMNCDDDDDTFKDPLLTVDVFNCDPLDGGDTDQQHQEEEQPHVVHVDAEWKANLPPVISIHRSLKLQIKVDYSCPLPISAFPIGG